MSNYYLDKMGITTWVLQKSSPIIYLLSDNSNLENPGHNDETLLFENILKALKIDKQKVYFQISHHKIHHAQLEQDVKNITPKMILILGEHLIFEEEKAHIEKYAIILPSLKNLIQNPSLKKIYYEKIFPCFFSD